MEKNLTKLLKKLSKCQKCNEIKFVLKINVV